MTRVLRVTLALVMMMAMNAVNTGVARGQSQIQLTAIAPPQVSVVTANVSGAPGICSYYYWVVANYPGGSALPGGPAPVFSAPCTLTGGNFVVITYAPIVGATSYDVIRQSTNQFPVSGSCTLCAVVTGTTSTAVSDNGGALGSYSLAGFPFSSATAFIRLNNRDYTTPQIEITNFQLRPLAGLAPGVGGVGINATQLVDANNNTVIATPSSPVVAPVNQITASNAATGNPPSLTATGTNTSIGLNIAAKGSGTVAITGVTTITGATTITGLTAVTGNETVSGTLTSGANSTSVGGLTSSASATGVTIAAASVINGVFVHTGVGAAQTDTTDTAVAIVALIPGCVGAATAGQQFRFYIRNGSAAQTLTFAGGVGVTLDNGTLAAAIAVSTTREYAAVVTNCGTPAITMTLVSNSTT